MLLYRDRQSVVWGGCHMCLDWWYRQAGDASVHHWCYSGTVVHMSVRYVPDSAVGGGKSSRVVSNPNTCIFGPNAD